MAERTAYQNAVAAGIAAAGHTVEWVSNGYGGEVLHIDGLHCGSNLSGEKPAISYVSDAVTCVSAWRARRLSPEAAKAVPVILDRHASVLHQRQRAAKVDATRRHNDTVKKSLLRAFGEVSGLQLEVSTERVTVTLTMPALTPDGAARLGAALREIVGT